ncbi:unnamed protein product [Dovyalis caffra]|uniref:Uncharacterized protein n=1 Tax=Dovyalis caffra TaxID=77055 RepID=A0AAV1RBU0_9ROSI|nr:unnamed protein product [Dovyalis caffra]
MLDERLEKLEMKEMQLEEHEPLEKAGILKERPLKEHAKEFELKERKVSDREVAALRSMLELIADNELEAKFMSKDIINSISYLEKKRSGWTHSSQAPATMDQTQLQGRKNHTVASVPIFLLQLQNLNSKDQLQLQDNKKSLRITDISFNKSGARKQKVSALIAPPHLRRPSFREQLQPQDNNKRPKIYVSADNPEVTSDDANYGGLTETFSGTMKFSASESNAQQ